MSDSGRDHCAGVSTKHILGEKEVGATQPMAYRSREMEGRSGSFRKTCIEAMGSVVHEDSGPAWASGGGVGVQELGWS